MVDLAELSPDITAVEERLQREQLKRVNENRLAHYKPYPKQLAFHAAGAAHRERLLMAGNQLGKTLAGGFEMAMHATGRYPPWWRGKCFNSPIIAWAAGTTGETVRDTVQRILVGRAGEKGTGAIPKDAIIDLIPARGVADLMDTIIVKHVSGGKSQIGLKSYLSGREKFQGETLQCLWFDEEPPADIYMEGLTRTNVGSNPVFSRRCWACPKSCGASCCRPRRIDISRQCRSTTSTTTRPKSASASSRATRRTSSKHAPKASRRSDPAASSRSPRSWSAASSATCPRTGHASAAWTSVGITHSPPSSWPGTGMPIRPTSPRHTGPGKRHRSTTPLRCGHGARICAGPGQGTDAARPWKAPASRWPPDRPKRAKRRRTVTVGVSGVSGVTVLIGQKDCHHTFGGFVSGVRGVHYTPFTPSQCARMG
jgi:phage terminase large subunit-like protein